MIPLVGVTMTPRLVGLRLLILTIVVSFAPSMAEAAKSRLKEEPQPPPIHRIALLGPEDPDYGLGEFDFWGTIKRRQEEFRALVKAKDFHFGTELRAAITAMLQSEGFEVVYVPVKHNEMGDMIDRDTPLGVQVDGVLDVALMFKFVGYSEAELDKIGPFAGVRVQLFRPGWKKRIFSDSIEYASYPAWTPILRADSKYVFGSADEVLKDPDRAIEGLRAGIPLITEEIRRSFSEEADRIRPQPINPSP
jgi:hypothetical protein